jgi:pimeloyl-ACP methyl ester carboxylesterase
MLEALPLITLLAPLCISLFCFDFSGCGLSEGEYISLGWFERDDLATCMEYLRSLGRVSRIALWGRSMGAFAALLHADRDPSIAGLVLDSPFISLSILAEELARSYAKVPSWMARAVLTMVRSTIKARAQFDIDSLDALNHVSCSFSPALFVAAHGDDFIDPHHAKRLYDAYQGEKELRLVDGNHNSARPETLRREAALFLCRAFHEDRLDRLLGMHTSGLFDIFNGIPKFPGSPTDAKGSGDDGDLICKQMMVFPAFRSMRLVHRRICHRSFTSKVSVKLQQDHSEAGIFVALEPLGTGHSTALSRFLILSVTIHALVLSRVCDDAVETIVATTGLPARQANHLLFEIDRAGNILVQLGSDSPVRCSLGDGYREQVTLWLMVLHGHTSFGPLHVEDGEATLRESLGDKALQKRHLGPTSGRQLRPAGLTSSRICTSSSLSTPRANTSFLITTPPNHHVNRFSVMPRGDSGLPIPLAMPVPSSPRELHCRPLPVPRAMTDLFAPLSPTGRPPTVCPSTPLCTDQLQLIISTELEDKDSGSAIGVASPSPADECETVVELCVKEPEALVGCRVYIDTIGEALVVGIKRRLGRSTQHIVSWSEDESVHRVATPARGRRFCSSRAHTSGAVMLRRKESHKRRCKGLAFQVLCREF